MLKKNQIIMWLIGGLIFGYVFVNFANSSSAQLKKDEFAIFFPTYGYEKSSGEWVIQVEGRVFEEEFNESYVNAFINKMLDLNGFARPKRSDQTNFYNDFKLFFVDSEERKKVTITLGGQNYLVSRSKKSGRIQYSLNIKPEAGKQLYQNAVNSGSGWASFFAQNQYGQTFKGKILLDKERTTGVISDIDDTIKITGNIKGKKEVMLNTFLRTPKPAKGMKELFEKFRKENKVTFHYVSGSPWKLFPFLEKYTDEYGFPYGTFHLREFNLKPTHKEFWSFLNDSDTKKHKIEVIEKLMFAFKNRNYILVGDSGQSDPQTYCEIANNHSDRILEIYIRDVNPENFNTKCWKNLQKGENKIKVKRVDPVTGIVSQVF